ncbi:porin family protein [Sulfurimonas sediminis]|uniref:Porin family protein n=1 Tax=Sulfurimonas sediminis TaxID=2590020 RepID=A0A7M1B3K5_9BACT|nr:porin family protein [Sulfurimonas sediminis]QOP44250.1 porin family protein [Sulfurimonas sediminis]
MKIQNFLCLSGMLLLSTTLFAAEGTHEEDASRAHIEAKHHEEGNLYIVTKGLISLGDNYTEEAKGTEPEALLKGDRGEGFGIDLGYRLGYGFATEFDFSYTHTTVTKSVVGEADVSAGADYYSYGLDLLYGYHVNEEIVLFGKVGWEIEKEKISDFGINGTNDGFTYAAGMEYGLSSHWALIGEYEGSLIDGPRGNNIFAGVSYTF